jgi:hypothetical protein
MAGNYQVKMDYNEVTQLSELKYSPFKDRICRVSGGDVFCSLQYYIDKYLMNMGRVSTNWL